MEAEIKDGELTEWMEEVLTLVSAQTVACLLLTALSRFHNTQELKSWQKEENCGWERKGYVKLGLTGALFGKRLRKSHRGPVEQVCNPAPWKAEAGGSQGQALLATE